MKKVIILTAFILFVFCTCANSGSYVNVQPSMTAQATDAPAAEATPTAKKVVWDQSAGLKAFFNMKKYYRKDTTAKDEKTIMPSNYGGCFINDSGTLTVCVVGLDDAAKEQYITACGTDNIEFKDVKYTLTELQAGMDALSEASKEGKILVFSATIRETDNRVETKLGSKAEAEAAAALMSDYPCIFFDYTEQTPTLSKYGETPEPGDVTIETEYASYPPDTKNISLFFDNKTDGLITYSHCNSLEILKDGEWYTIPYRPGVAFTTELPGLGAGAERQIIVNLPAYNYQITEGTYRIVLNYDKGGTNFNRNCFAEFKISEAAKTCDPDLNITDGQEENSEKVARFFRKCFAGIKCSLRVINPESGTAVEYTYNGICYGIEGRYYRYLYTSGGSVYLTSYYNLSSADPKFVYSHDITCIDGLAGFLSGDEKKKLLERINKDTDEHGSIITRQQYTLSENGEVTANVDVMEIHNDDGSTGFDYQFFYSERGHGKLVDSAREDSGKPLPVYVFNVKGSVFGVVYRGESEWTVKTYDAESEKFLDTWTATDIDTLLADTFGLTKAAY